MLQEQCPNCKHDLGVTLSRYFWSDPVGKSQEFDYTCPNCRTSLKVEVEPQPIFLVRLGDLVRCESCGEIQRWCDCKVFRPETGE